MSMDVRDLAPALLSVGNLFQTLNRQIHPADPEIQVNIRATEEGSFLVQLKLLYDHTANVLGNRGLIEGEGLAGLIGGLVALINYLCKRGQAGRPVETRDDATVRLTWPEGTVLEMPANVFLLADDPAVRKPLAEVVKPVGREGVDSLRLVKDGVGLGEIDTDNLPAFQADSVVEGHILKTSERDTYLRILTSAWQVGRKWRFTDGRWPFWAVIVDDAFNAGIAVGERYGANDLLHCQVGEVQWEDDAGLHTGMTVLRVIERIDASKNQPLAI